MYGSIFLPTFRKILASFKSVVIIERIEGNLPCLNLIATFPEVKEGLEEKQKAQPFCLHSPKMLNCETPKDKRGHAKPLHYPMDSSETSSPWLMRTVF